jgi:hypothetical protein
MKIARLCLIIFALTTTLLSAAPKHKGGGSVAYTKSAGEYEYYCYSDPDFIVPCSGTSCNCRAECDKACKGVCDWDGSCIIV